MKYAIITDTHFGVRGDSTIMQQSMKKFFDNVFFPTLDEHGIRRVLHGGDYGDRRKYVNFATAKFVFENYRQPMRMRGIQEDAIVGNHDIFFRDTTELNAIEELYRDDSSINVYRTPIELDLDGLGVLLLPWIASNNYDASMRAIETTKCSVILGHLEIQGFQMHRGMPSREGLKPEMFDRFELVMSGHYHHRSWNGPVHYLGAPYPMIWSDYRDSRGFHIFDSKTRELTFIENPYSIFMRIEYDDTGKKHDYIKQLVGEILAPNSNYHDAYVKVVVKSKTQPYWFDLMMDALYKVNAQDIMVVDDIIVDDIEEGETPAHADVDTLTLMRDYVESLSINCNRDELFAYLRAKYQEAVSQSQSARLS